MAGGPARFSKALREETARSDAQGLKFGDNRAYQFPIEEFYIPLPRARRSRRAMAAQAAVRCPCLRIEVAVFSDHIARQHEQKLEGSCVK